MLPKLINLNKRTIRLKTRKVFVTEVVPVNDYLGWVFKLPKNTESFTIKQR